MRGREPVTENGTTAGAERLTYFTVTENEFDGLKALQIGYKKAIGEDAPTEEDLERRRRAIREKEILFFACADGNRLIGCCSVSPTFSTFRYERGGVFEDFYIVPEYRHKGIARKLTEFAFRESGVGSLTVGCADCDTEMYKALGFGVSLGNMLAYDG